MKHFLIPGMIYSFMVSAVLADGKIFAPADYKGSLEELAQEAIIIYTGGTEEKSAVEELVLKIQVEGAVDSFAWVVPFPQVPRVDREDAKLFEECFRYVQFRRTPVKPEGGFFGKKAAASVTEEKDSVEVISREIVGSYDVAVVKEQVAGTLNQWLVDEGYQGLDDAEDVVGYYRKKGYVFACIKVADAELKTKKRVDLHPLRFTFSTGGRDGIYFPMKMTGLQKAPFDVNLYVFCQSWLNDHLNGYGYEHRGFELNFRDFDTRKCEANAGKTWSLPAKDPYLASAAHLIPGLKKYFQKRHPGERFYLTNVKALQLKAEEVRDWKNDLWMFPFYTDKSFVPYDARKGGVASGD